ncbi:glycosyltransferase [Micrococcus luteus]|nr:glycosyltransferase [Micrococcus luteus]
MRYRSASTPRFSVIVPTLQRATELVPLVDMCARHPLVGEVIVVNNAPAPLHWHSDKVHVLDQEENIFVNPAWNLGVSCAKEDLVAVVNDDVLFDPKVFDAVAEKLSKPWVGMIGLDGAFINRKVYSGVRFRLATYSHITLGFGVFMAMRRSDYLPIPNGPKIWGGDDWLFMTQRRPNWVIQGGSFRTDMSVSSSSAEFQCMRLEEVRLTEQILRSRTGRCWWRWPMRAIELARKLRGRLTL